MYLFIKSQVLYDQIIFSQVFCNKVVFSQVLCDQVVLGGRHPSQHQILVVVLHGPRKQEARPGLQGTKGKTRHPPLQRQRVICILLGENPSFYTSQRVLFSQKVFQSIFSCK